MSVGELSRARFRRMFTGQYTCEEHHVVGELSRARFRRMFTGQYTYR